MQAESFQTLDVVRAQQALAELHQQIARGRRRVTLTRDGCDEVCVIISKEELDALERAIDILSSAEEVKAMCAELSKLGIHCTERHVDTLNLPTSDGASDAMMGPSAG